MDSTRQRSQRVTSFAQRCRSSALCSGAGGFELVVKMRGLSCERLSHNARGASREPGRTARGSGSWSGSAWRRCASQGRRSRPCLRRSRRAPRRRRPSQRPAPTPSPTTVAPTTTTTGPATTSPGTTPPATSIRPRPCRRRSTSPRPVVHLVRGRGGGHPHVPARQPRHRAGRGHGAQRRDGESVAARRPGRSTWDVPAGDGATTTEVVVDGQVVATSDSTNLMCGALHGHAECNPSQRDHDHHMDREQQRRVAGHRARATRAAWTSSPTRTRHTASRPASRSSRAGERRGDHRDGHDPAGGRRDIAAQRVRHGGRVHRPEPHRRTCRSRSPRRRASRRPASATPSSTSTAARTPARPARGRAPRRRPTRCRHRAARRGDRRGAG